MLIGLCGPRFAGRRTVAEYLEAELGFTSLQNASLFCDSGINCDTDITVSDEVVPTWRMMSQCWRSNINMVIKIIEPDDPALPHLLKRPYFMLVFVDAPVVTRFERGVQAKMYAADELLSFVKDDDNIRYEKLPKSNGIVPIAKEGIASPRGSHGSSYSLSNLEKQSRLSIVNNFEGIPALFESLREINFTDPERLRPSWDTYFMSLAKLAAERTNCMKRRVGCVIARNKRMVATGYNGTPSGVRNCADGGCDRCNGAHTKQGAGLDLCLCLHAEENAIIEAGRERCEGSTLYSNLFPCILCSKKIVQSGISRIVFDKHYATDGAAESLLRAGNVVVDGFRKDEISRTLGNLIL